MSWESALGEACLTVIVGVVVYALGIVVVNFYVKPVNKLSKSIGEILDSLVYYANIYTNPAWASITPEQEKSRNDAKDTLRHNATFLLSRASQIRLYSVASTLRIIPTKQAINEAHSDLIFLSNACLNRLSRNDINPIDTFQVAERIKKLLTSNGIPPPVPPQNLVTP